jgi:hypothetical protein
MHVVQYLNQTSHSTLALEQKKRGTFLVEQLKYSDF